MADLHSLTVEQGARVVSFVETKNIATTQEISDYFLNLLGTSKKHYIFPTQKSLKKKGVWPRSTSHGDHHSPSKSTRKAAHE